MWNRACVGEIADFNTEPGYGGDLDPKRPEGLPDNRVLLSSFIETVLLTEKYRHALTRNGLRIWGARFKDRLDLRNAELAHDLWLDHSLLEKGADLSGLRSTGRITLDDTRVAGSLKMAELRVDRDLSMRRSKLTQVNLPQARIGETPDLTQSEVASVNLAATRIGGALILEQSKITGDADLTFARIGAVLDFDGCKSSGKLDMAGISAAVLIMTHGQFELLRAWKWVFAWIKVAVARDRP